MLSLDCFVRELENVQEFYNRIYFLLRSCISKIRKPVKILHTDLLKMMTEIEMKIVYI